MAYPKKAELDKMARDMADRISMLKSYSNGVTTKKELERIGIKLVKPF